MIRSRGQSLVEFCILLQIIVASFALMTFVGIKTLMPFLMTLDLYDLARAHLYGNELNHCEASSLWPRNLIEVQVTCLKIPELYEASSFLLWNEKRVPLAQIHYGLWGAQ